MVDEMRMMKGLSPDRSTGRRRGIRGLRKKKVKGGRWPSVAPNPLRGGALEGLNVRM
jgi:hypothetical protein